MLLGTALGGASVAMGQSAEAAGTGLDPEAESDVRKVTLKDTPHTRAYYALARS
jgi:hypothetical protein